MPDNKGGRVVCQERAEEDSETGPVRGGEESVVLEQGIAYFTVEIILAHIIFLVCGVPPSYVEKSRGQRTNM